jgi:hypothetical protein
MKRALFLVPLLMLCAGDSGQAAVGGCTNSPTLAPMGFEQVTVSTDSIGFTAATYAPTGAVPADMAVVVVESAAIRYRDDGPAPTSTVGVPIAAAGAITVCGTKPIRSIRFIRSGGSDATLSVSYYRGE